MRAAKCGSHLLEMLVDIRYVTMTQPNCNRDEMEMIWLETVLTHWSWKNKPFVDSFNWKDHIFPHLQMDPLNIDYAPFLAVRNWLKANGVNQLGRMLGQHGANFPQAIAHVVFHSVFLIPNIEDATIADLESINYNHPRMVRHFMQNVLGQLDPIRRQTVVLTPDKLKFLKAQGIGVPRRLDLSRNYRHMELEWLEVGL